MHQNLLHTVKNHNNALTITINETEEICEHDHLKKSLLAKKIKVLKQELSEARLINLLICGVRYRC